MRTKILGLVGMLSLLITVGSGISIWSVQKELKALETMVRYYSEAMKAHDVIVLTLQSYQNQADTTINWSDDKEFNATTAALREAI